MKDDPKADVRFATPAVGVPIGSIKAYLTFYRSGRGEITGKTWLPGVPAVGQSMHPGDSMGEEFERCWEVLHVRWVFENDRWHLEIGLT